MPADQLHLIFNQRPQAAGTYSRRLNLMCYKKVDFFLRVSGVAGVPTSGTLDVKLQYKFPGIGTSWVDFPVAKAFTQVAFNASFPVTQVLQLLETDLRSADMRVVVTAVLGGGSSPSFTVDLGYVATL